MDDEQMLAGSPPADTEETSVKRPLIRRILDKLFGYDYFISYRWKDGRDYAVSLAKQLEARGYEVFLDSDDYVTGDDWKHIGAWTLKRTGQLILVGTDESLVSPDVETPVEREVRLFSKTNRRINAIAFAPRGDDGKLDHSRSTIARARSHSRVVNYLNKEMIIIHEDESCIRSGPRAETLETISRSFGLLRQDRWRLRWMFGIVSLLCMLLIISTASALYAKVQLIAANLSRGESLAKAAQLMLSRPMTPAEANDVVEMARLGYELNPSSDAWNAIHRVPLVNYRVQYCGDEIDGYCVVVRRPDQTLLFLDKSQRSVTVFSDDDEVDGEQRQFLGRSLFEHSADITALAANANGSHVAVGDVNGNVIVVALANPAERTEYPHSGKISSIALSADARYVAAASVNGRVRAWMRGEDAVIADSTGCAENSLIAVNSRGEFVAFESTSRELIMMATSLGPQSLQDNSDDATDVSSPNGISGTTVARDNGGHWRRTVVRASKEPFQFAFSRDGRRCVIAEKDGSVRVLAIESGFEHLQLPARASRSVELSPNGAFVAYEQPGRGNSSYEIRVLSIADNYEVILASERQYPLFRFTPDGGTLVIEDEQTSGAGGETYLGVFKTDDQVGELRRLSPPGHVEALTLSLQDDALLTVDGDGVAQLTSLVTGKSTRQCRFESGRLMTAASPNGKLMAVADGQGNIVVWPTVRNQPERRLRLEKEIAALGFTYDSSLVVVDSEANIAVFDDDGKLIRSLAKSTDSATEELPLTDLTDFVFGSNGRCLAMTDGNTIVVRALEDWSLLAVMDCSELETDWDSLTAMATSGDGRYVAMGQASGTVSVFNGGDNKASLIRKYTDRINGLCFSRNGERIYISCQDGMTRIVSIADGVELARINHSRKIIAAALGPNEELATFGDDGTVRVWDSNLGKMKERVVGHR